MSKVSCVIIEDEKPAQEILRSYIAKVEWLELVAVLDDAITAMNFLRRKAVDIIFLDIQVPELSGLEFLKVSKTPAAIIITTAYSEHAIEAFEFAVMDYLKKPFSFERFLKAVNRISHGDMAIPASTAASGAGDEPFAFFNVNKKMVKVIFSQILFIESMKEYVYIFTDQQKIATKISTQEIGRMLGPDFLRIHRSFIVNSKRVTSYTAEEVFVNDKALPIGVSYKKQVEMFFGRQAFQ